MNICFLEGDMSRKGGTERMTAMLANALSETHRVFVVSLKSEDNHVFLAWLILSCIPCFPLPSENRESCRRSGRFIGSFWRIRSIV